MIRRLGLILLSLGVLATPARGEDPDTLLRALMEYFPAAAGSMGAMATSTVTFGARAYTYHQDLKRLEALINENEPLFRENLAKINDSFNRLNDIYAGFERLALILPEEKRSLQALEQVVKKHGLETLAAHPKVGSEWAAEYQRLRGEERAHKQALATAWNQVLETGKDLGDSKVHRLSEKRAESLLHQIQGSLNNLAMVRPLVDPDGNEPLGKLVRDHGTHSEAIPVSQLRDGELPGLSTSCRHALAGIRGMRRGVGARRSRIKIYAGLSGASGLTTVGLAAAWLYIKYNPLEEPTKTAPSPSEGPTTTPSTPPIALEELNEAPLDFGGLPSEPKPAPTNEVGRAGETTEKISERRNQTTPPKEQDTTSGIAGRRRRK